MGRSANNQSNHYRQRAITCVQITAHETRFYMSNERESASARKKRKKNRTPKTTFELSRPSSPDYVILHFQMQIWKRKNKQENTVTTQIYYIISNLAEQNPAHSLLIFGKAFESKISLCRGVQHGVIMDYTVLTKQ